MKFNTAAPTTKTINLAGGEAHVQSARFEIASLLLTSFVQDQFYRTADNQVERALVLADADPKFAAKAAIFARNEFGMRSITHVVAALVGNRVKGEEWTRRFFERVVRRPDDVLEILAFSRGRYGKVIPNAMKKGLGKAIAGFDSYQLAKYRARGKAMSMVDAVNLLHPPHTDAIAALVNGTLAPADTWETQVSAAGGNKEAANAAWRDLVAERKIGYFALLRNLRNILQTEDGDLIGAACDMLRDPKLIRKSKVLPFRYMTAMAQLQQERGAGRILGAISDALDIAVANVPPLAGRTKIAVDVSGSMTSTWGHASKQKPTPPIEHAALFAAVLSKIPGVDVVLFDTKLSTYVPNPRDPVTTITENIKRLARGGGTDFSLIFDDETVAYDRIIILSDMQAWVGWHTPKAEATAYRQRTGANPHIYCFDFAGYGTLQFPEKQVYQIAGFSEKVLDIMALLEKDRNALVNTIEAIEL